MKTLAVGAEPLPESRRRGVAVLIPILLVSVACESSDQDPLEGLLEFSASHRTLQTLTVERVQPVIRMRVPPGVPMEELEDISSVLMRWPDNVHVDVMVPAFEPDGSGGHVTVWAPSFEAPLPEGAYAYEVFAADLHPRFERLWNHQVSTFMESIQPREVSVGPDGVEFAWTAPPQPHEWRLSVQRIFPEPVVEVGTASSGTGSGSVDWVAAVTDVVWQGSSEYHLVLELVNDWNERVFTFRVQPPGEEAF